MIGISARVDATGIERPYPSGVLARIRSVPPGLLDWTLALGLTAYAEVDVWLRPGVVPGPKVVGAIGLALMTVPLALRRRWPLAVAFVSMAALAAESLAAGGGAGGGGVLLALPFVVFTLGGHQRVPRARGRG